MNKPFIEIDAENFTLSAFEIKPSEGYELPVNEETGAKFPYCCPFHKGLFEEAVKWFESFPNCCEPHKMFIGKWWFKKEKFNGIAEKIVKQLSYTEHLISQQHTKPDWYKNITDYIECNVSSFGHPAVGLHLYLGYLKHYLKITKEELNAEQRKRLIEFIEGYYRTDEKNKADLNILFTTYQKWLKEFPFDLNSYFGNLKQHFVTLIPILNGKPEVNPYSGIAKVKMHTKSSLIEALINLTNNLLTQINGVSLYEKGLINDANKIKLELVISSRKLKLKQGYKNSSPNEEQQYRNIIKEWYKDEKIFFDEITPLLKALPPQQAEVKTEQETIDLKPVLNPDAVQIVFDILKDFFSIEHQTEFKKLIETGNKANSKLLFKGNGNRLTDTFKKLIEHDFITGCQKQDLINWIISNFTFINQNKAKAFIYDTVEKTISRNFYPCKSPLIEIKNGQIQKVEQPRKRKQSNY